MDMLSVNLSTFFLELLILFAFETCCDYIFHKFIACYVRKCFIVSVKQISY